MKKLGFFLMVSCFLFATARGIYRYIKMKDYDNRIESYWDLSEKASTISQKSEYMDKFVSSLQSQNLSGLNSAYFYETTSKSFDENFKALKSLQNRLHDISKMDETGFAYQTAIQQITQQEQGEGKDMLAIFNDCWDRKYCYSLWNPIICFVFVAIPIIGFVIGAIIVGDWD